MDAAFTLAELAKAADGVVRGDAALRIEGVASLDTAGPTDISWVSSPKYASMLATTGAGAVVVATGFDATPVPAILVGDPDLAVIEILSKFAPPAAYPPAGIDPSAVVDPAAVLGAGVAVGPNAVVGAHARIGDRTVLSANVVIGPDCVLGADCVLWPGVVVRERCRLGDRVVCQPNATIGADGFGYHFAGGRHHKIPQIGTVLVEDDVEIGAGSCIDRAKMGQTRIGAGTKIDNLVQIGHNVTVGSHSLIVAQVGVAGSARIGAYVVLGGRAGVVDHVAIGDQTQAAACCLITKDVPAGSFVNGNPAIDNRRYLREQALVRRLPEYVKLLKDLSARVKHLEAAADD